MASYSTVDIALAWSQSLVVDRVLQDWVRGCFSKELRLRVGEDMRRLPESGEAPFISIFPDTGHVGAHRVEHSHEIGLVVGIDDDQWIEEGGVMVMRGLVSLDEVCRLIRVCLSKALPPVVIQNISIDYEILQFPLLMALFSITVEEKLPLGKR